MKRQIKFRGKTKSGEWVYGDLVHNALNAHSRIIEAGIKQYGYYPVEVLPETVGEFVGNVNGKDIYEGDYDEDGNMVEWCEQCFGWQFKQVDIPTKDVIFCHNCEGNFMFQDLWNDFKPIGNIHQNPELLK